MYRLALGTLYAGLISLMMPFYALAGVEGQVNDQSNEILNYTGCMTIGNNNRAQTFKPSLNRVLDVEAMFSDKQIGTEVTLTIKKESTGATVGTSSHALTVDGQGWEPFTFDEPFLTVTPEESYGMYFTANDNDTKWCYGGDTYSRGQAVGFPTLDFVFVEVGKNDSTPDAPATTSSTAAATTAVTSSSATSQPTSAAKSQSTASPKASSVSSTTGEYIDDSGGGTEPDLIATAATATASPETAGMLQNKSLWIYLAILLAAIALGLWLFFYLKRKKKNIVPKIEG